MAFSADPCGPQIVPAPCVMSVGRPNIIIGEIVLAAGTQGTIVLAINTGARFVIHKLVALLDRAPLWALALCDIDVRGIRITSEEYSSEENILVGVGNMLAVFGGNGCIQGDLLGDRMRIRQGTQVNIDLTNLDAVDAHRVTVAAHGVLARTAESSR